MSIERINYSDLKEYLPSGVRGEFPNGEVVVFTGCREKGKPFEEKWLLEMTENEWITISEDEVESLQAGKSKQTQKNWTKFQHYSNRRTK